ncbi:MAG: NUDIX hydrolase [Deltaproteobacteria bacterium]|jgi:8-oxo-dGTP pyrophosphatase MutT (NUDIX family)|nr:NUDIX hydrolase [Deltaproteobacteria bacterium]
MTQLKQWQLIDESVTYQTPVFNVLDRRCLSPKDGREKTFACLQSPEWVNVLAVTAEGKFLLVDQFRHGSRDFCLEIPGGVVEPGQSLEETARRELMEETGYSAARLELLCSFKPNPALFSNRVHTFLAYEAAPTGQTDFDENEEMSLSLATIDELKAMILDGRIDHALMVAAISFYLLKNR